MSTSSGRVKELMALARIRPDPAGVEQLHETNLPAPQMMEVEMPS
jgi:hypothetical protein